MTLASTFLTHWGQDKRAEVLLTTLQVCFLDRKSSNLNFKFTEVPTNLVKQSAPKRLHANNCTNCDPIFWHIYASSDLTELTHCPQAVISIFQLSYLNTILWTTNARIHLILYCGVFLWSLLIIHLMSWVNALAKSHPVKSYCLMQRWLRYTTPHGTTCPQWVDTSCFEYHVSMT